MTTSVLPQDLLAALPADPAAQLELAQKISSNAFASRSAGLEAEVAQLRAQLGAKAQALKAAEGAAAELRVELDEARERARQSLEEQSKLVGEKNSLAEQVKKLSRDNARLGAFKRNLLQSLQDEDASLPAAAAEASDTSFATHAVAAAPPPAESPQRSAFAAGPPETPAYGYTAPAAAPSSTYLGGYGARAVQPIAPSSPRLPGRTPAGGALPPSSPQVNGREFFRQARVALSHPLFEQFLLNIKELNAHRQTREETLRRARDIFGVEHQELYQTFEGLLNRHLPLQ